MYGYVIEAQYEDGFTLAGPGLEQMSPFGQEEHVARAIINGRATDAGHGPLVRFSLIPEEEGIRYDIDWTALADLDHVRPVYFRAMARAISCDAETGEPIEGTDSGTVCLHHGFGYQYNGPDGENVQVIEEVT